MVAEARRMSKNGRRSWDEGIRTKAIENQERRLYTDEKNVAMKVKYYLTKKDAGEAPKIGEENDKRGGAVDSSIMIHEHTIISFCH